MGYGDVSCYNSQSKVDTPHIDALADLGVRFTDAHTSSAVCTPTRYSILTGRYNWRSWLKRSVLSGVAPPLLESDRLTVPRMMQDVGYSTYCIGKWHLGLGWEVNEGESFSREDELEKTLDRTEDYLRVDYHKPVTTGPNDFGFDYSYIIPASLDIPPYVYLENGKCTGIPTEDNKLGVDNEYLMRRGLAVSGMKAENVLPNFTDKVEEVIRAQNKDKPFYIYFPLTAPHTPIVPTDEFKGTTDIGLYGDFCSQIDSIVGRIVKAVKEQGLEEDTLIVFTSDNGSSPAADLDGLREKGHLANGQWRGHKADLYEGGHRVPYIMKWPNGIPAGDDCKQTICTTDLMATLADVTGTQLPKDAGEDSFNLMPMLNGDKHSSREATIHHSVEGAFAIRKGPWKFLESAGSGGWSYPTSADLALMDSPKYQLYNLNDDPAEKNNLFETQPEKSEELLRLLYQYRDEGRSVSLMN